MSHCVGFGVQLPSMPLVIVYSAKPGPSGLCQPRPIASIGAISGGGPISSADDHAVALAEGVAAGDQRDGLLVVHRHAREGDADVAGRGHRVAVGVWAFGVDVDQRLVRGRKRVFEIVVGVAVLAAPALVARHHARRRTSTSVGSQISGPQ